MSAGKPETAEKAPSASTPAVPAPLLLRRVGLKTFWDERHGILWWSSGTAVLSAVVVLLFPSVASGPELEALIERLPPALRALLGEDIELTTIHGYLDLRMFTFIAPVIFLIYAIGRGSSAIAGEERRGTMDLLLALPVKRWRLVVEKYVAMLAGLIIIGFGLWLGIVVGAVIVDVTLDFNRAAQATLMAVLFAAFHGALALAVGGWTGRTGPAIGVSAAVGIAGYFLYTLAPLVDWLEPFQILSPFYYYTADSAILMGMNAEHAIVLVILATLLVAVAVWAFERRDVQV